MDDPKEGKMLELLADAADAIEAVDPSHVSLVDEIREFVGNHNGFKPKPFVYPIEIMRVVDGDTIDARIDRGFHDFFEHRIRLEGIQCPEMRGEHQEAGEVAKSFVVNKVKLAGGVGLLDSSKLEGSFGSFGRCLGQVWIGDESKTLNDQLLENKFAIPYRKK